MPRTRRTRCPKRAYHPALSRLADASAGKAARLRSLAPEQGVLF